MSEFCEKLNWDLTSIKPLKVDFDLELEESIKSGDTSNLKEANDRLKARLHFLEEELVIEVKLKLKDQYESQVNILESTNLVERLSDGRDGIKVLRRTIDGMSLVEYPIPSYEQVLAKFEEQRYLIRDKYEQGFDKLLLVPFGLKLSKLIDRYGATILQHRDNLRDSQGEKVEVTGNNPIFRVNTKEELAYFPQELSENPQGKNKEDIEPWQILLTPDTIIPREGHGETKAGRKELEAGKSPIEYLRILKIDPQYQGESGLTPEDWIMYAITKLEESGTVIDNFYNKKDSTNYNIRAHYRSTIPGTCWNRAIFEVLLGEFQFDTHEPEFGCRTSVRLGLQ
jgi:hypothetical protein